jgi:hypothetical protein
MRVSDEDRRRVVDELRRHCAAGRIDVDEYASRIERALAATSFEELDALRSDLPMIRIAEPNGSGIWAGRKARDDIAPIMSRSGGDGGGGGVRQPHDKRPIAMLFAVVTVAVVMAAIVLGVVVEWTWSVVIILAWVVGLVQGRVTRRRRS